MKKVLIYQNRKSESYVWDVSDGDKALKAFISLFNLLDETFQVYDNIREDGTKEQIRWYKEAKKGDYVNLTKLLNARKNYEYEEWYISTVES